MKNPELEPMRLGSLDALATPMELGAVERTVVLLHGYGAPGTDLAGLAGYIDAPAGTRFVFPQAPLLLDPDAGPLGGRAWWHIDMLQLQMARYTGNLAEIAAWHPEGLDSARTALAKALAVLCEEHGMKPSRSFVGGFSQGAMLTCDWALRTEEELAGLIQLSGTVICEDEWQPLWGRRPPLRVFQSHSPDDPILPYELAEQLAASMKAAGWEHTFVPFAGGHGIAPEVLAGLSRFVTSS